MATPQERDRRAEKPLRFFVMTEGQPRRPFAETGTILPDNMQESIDKYGAVVAIPFRFQHMIGEFTLNASSDTFDENYIKGADFPLGLVHKTLSFNSDGIPSVSQAPLEFAVHFSYSAHLQEDLEHIQQYGAKVRFGDKQYSVYFNDNDENATVDELIKYNEFTTSHSRLETDEGDIPYLFLPYNNDAIRQIEVEFLHQNPDTEKNGIEVFSEGHKQT